MKKIVNLLWLFALVFTQVNAQSKSTFYGLSRTTNSTGSLQVTQEIGTVNTGSFNTSKLTGLKSYPLDFNIKPYLRDSTLNYYEIGLIPNQTVMDGTFLHFYVKCDSLKVNNKIYSISPTLKPKGILDFTANLQYFYFAPSSADTISFFVNFIATNGIDTIKQLVPFRVYKQFSSGNYIFGTGNSQQLPDSTGNAYQVVTITKNQSEIFNGINQLTRTIDISAIDLTAEDSTGNFLMSLSGNKDIKQLNIYAERLYIKDTLHLPQTEVNIYCRQIIFMDVPGKPRALINTTPITPLATFGRNGINGGNAGNINLFSSQMIDNTGGLRYRLIGGNGGASNTTAGNGGNGGILFSDVNLQNVCDLIGGLGGGNTATIYKGKDGAFEMDSIEGRWIHPNYIREILAYSDDAYYMGLGAQVLSKLVFYSNLIKPFINSTNFNALDSYTKTDLMQVDMELISLVNQISAGLDYYGNPVGWVPMLSFEFAEAAFESELQNAANLLYLDYFVTANADSISSYTSLQAQLHTQSIADESNYNNLVTYTIPIIQSQINQNEQLMQSLKQQIEQVTSDLEREAAAKYKNIMDSLAKVAQAAEENAAFQAKRLAQSGSSVPGIIGDGLSVLGFLANQKPNRVISIDNFQNSSQNKVSSIDDAVIQGFGAYDSLTNGFNSTYTSWNNIGAQLQNIYPIFQGGNSINGVMNQIQKGQELYVSLDSIYNSVLYIYNNYLEIPNQELQQIRSNLMSNSTELVTLYSSFLQTADSQKKLADLFNNTNTQIQSLGSEISAEAIAFNNVNSKLLNDEIALDHRTVLYIQYLTNNALSILKKYQYYMVNTYQFRTLQPYTGNMNIAPIVTSIQNLASTATNSQMTQEQFNNIVKTPYLAQISQVASGIYTYYQNNAPSQTITTSYIFPKSDLQMLNKGKTIFFNPTTKGLFHDNEENIRINSISVLTLVPKIGEGSLGNTKNIDVKFEYPDESLIKSNGKVYYFNNYNINTQFTINWGSRYDLNTKQNTAFQPSAATQSLLQSLLLSQSLPSQNKDLLMYSSPSAMADLIVSTNYLNAGGTASIGIDSMVIQINYDFTPKPVDISYLEIYPEPDWIVPDYIVSKADNNGMQDGQGQMIRSYTTSSLTKVKLETDNAINGYRFARWLDRYGNPITTADSTNPAKTFTMSQNQVYEAQYVWAGPILALPDTLYFTPSHPTKPLLVKNKGGRDMFWEIDNMTSWVSSGNVKYGYNNYTLSVTVNNINPADSIGYIVFIAPDAQNAIDTVWIKYTGVTLSSTLTPAPICSNTLFSYTPTSETPGATFNWSRAAESGISNSAAKGPNKINEILINTTSEPIDVIYAYILAAKSKKDTQNVVVTVNPLPKVKFGKDTIISTADVLILDAGAGNTYLWSNGSTAETLTVDGSKLGIGNYKYSVTVTNITNCKTIDTIMVSILNPNKFIGLNLGTLTACNNDSILIPVNTTNFNDVGALGIYIAYDSLVIKFTGLKNINSQLTGGITSNSKNNVLLFAWEALNVPANIGNGKLFDIQFVYNKGSTSLNFLPKECEIDDFGTFTPFVLTFTNGAINGIISNIKGTVTYDNILSSTLSNVKVLLIDNEGKRADSTMTDQTGKYSFSNIVCGNYTINGMTTKAVGGISPVDALIDNRYYIKLYNFPDNLKEKAGDVNNDGKINPIDALLINRFYVRLVSKFTAGNWLFASTNLHLNGEDTTYNFKGICYGDVNASYNPPARITNYELGIRNEEEINIDLNEPFDIPIYLNDYTELGAMGIKLKVKSEKLKVIGVKSDIDGLLYNITDDGVYIAWAAVDEGYGVKPDKPLLVLSAQCSVLSNSINDIIQITSEGELADIDINLISTDKLEMPNLIVNSQQSTVTFSCYPNPFNNITNINYTIPEDANVEIDLYNVLGEKIATLVTNERQQAGSYSLQYDGSNLKQGVYYCELRIENGDLRISKTNILMIAR